MIRPLDSEIPSERDWGRYSDDIDQRHAFEMFGGKEAAEVEPYFENCAIDAVDAIRFMPVVPFQYYLRALAEYLVSGEIFTSDLAPDAGSCFLNLVLEKLQDAPSQILPVAKDLIPAVKFVAENQEALGADIDVYGSFADKAQEILRLINRA